MFSTTKLPTLPHMMAHASSADAPFDSEVLSNADLDSLASVTTPSATTPTTSLHLDIDILAQLMNTTPSTSTSNSQNNSATDLLLSDHSILATSSSTSWTASPSISPMVLKLESPLLSHLEVPSSSKKSSRRASTSSTATATTANNSSSRKRSAVEPADKEAKARERVLRNRAAAQESRDKKRKYVAEIEASNENLQEENCQLLKRLKTVESDNLSLHQRLEALTAQFAQMQQQLASSSPSVKYNTNNQPGVGFCQSAVLAKKDRRSRETDTLTNSPQQKLAPTQRNPHTTISTNNKPRRVYSMTMKTLMTSKQSLNREARSLSDPSAAPQKWMEISCRPSCNNNHNCRRKKALTLSSSAAASFPTTTLTSAVPAAAYMMVFLANMVLPQLMLNFSTLFLISTGAQSSNPQLLPPLPQQEQQLRQAVLTFIQQRQRLFSSPLLSNTPTVAPRLLQSQPRTIKDDITSLHPSVIEDIVTEFRQGRKEAARGLLVRALVSSRLTLDSDEICKRLSLLRKK
ncbi:hypothetical protein KI688_011795 [Linnemannia hyalina]|uniref:BZIP domain-containing protein n=1 Tax=Linnemannia hyalina TaxID=64524 RepID=A0A9P8BU14_9FUNG|nr:hypothetical protein KI688_011795 [Linnemannia hyalina]